MTVAFAAAMAPRADTCRPFNLTEIDSGDQRPAEEGLPTKTGGTQTV